MAVGHRTRCSAPLSLSVLDYEMGRQRRAQYVSARATFPCACLGSFLSGFDSVYIFMSPVIHLPPMCQQPSVENKSLTLGLE